MRYSIDAWQMFSSASSVASGTVLKSYRQVEASQSMIRVVGLSATLPNYTDVAEFLGVNPDVGLFHFDASYRCPHPSLSMFTYVTDLI